MSERSSQEAPQDNRVTAMYYEAEVEAGVPLPYVANVSLPRSGHHLFVRMMRLYFGQRFGYCEFYGPNAKPKCCGDFPCARPGRISMSKNHDFGLRSTLPQGFPVIVQMRRPLPALVSEFELHVANGNPDTADEFAAFAEGRADRYRRFQAKWVTAPMENRHVLWYEDLCRAPLETFAAAARLFGVDAIDGARADDAFQALPQLTVSDKTVNVVTGKGIREGRDVTSFRFYEPALFARLSERAGAR